MATNDIAGSLFIREDAILPGGLIIETETFLPGWRALRDCDGYRLGRKIEQAKWNFFFLAGDVKAVVFGRRGPSSLRRALHIILAKPAARKFNSLEIRETCSRRFLGIPFLIVTANFRHIQQGLALDQANDFNRKAPAAPEGSIAANNYGTLVSSS
jgi:hypothetical protein